MKQIAIDIERTIEMHARVISGLSDADLAFKISPEKWSIKEIVGHLIDSAQNNIQRFVRGQYETSPRIVYAQDDWVRLQDYQHCKKDDLLELWVRLNRHLCRILTAMAPENYEKTCNTGKNSAEMHSLHFLAKDYLIHLLHHLNQIEKDISTKQ